MRGVNQRGLNLQAVFDAVARLKNRGADVGLRNGYGRYGLSNGDESRDISPLLPPRELKLYVLGYEGGWNERDSRGRRRE